MELDDMKQAWASVALRQDELATLLREDLHGRLLDKARAALRWNLLARSVELLMWVGATIFIASFWVEHRHALHWLVIGLVLHVYCVAAIWSSATQLLFMVRIWMFDAPIITQQRRLAQLRRFRFYSTLLLGLPWWCLWLLATAVGAQWLIDVDIYTMASPGWFWGTLGVGVVGMLASLAWARHLARRPIRSAWLREVVANLSGCSLRRASRHLDEIARFEQE